jgi:hypothetical protein
MKRIAAMTALLIAGLTAGCVERRFVVNSDPPGALVYYNGVYLGPAPVDGYIIYYGKQHFRLIKEGYETLDVVQKYPPPWYEWPGIDFVTENIWPFKVRDVRKFCYTMQPLQTIPPDDVRARAEELRARGQTIGVPRPPVPVPPAPPGTTPPGAILEGPAPAAPTDGTLPTPRPVPPPQGTLQGSVNGP